MLNKLIHTPSDAEKAAFEKLTSERTGFETPAPMTPLERAECIVSDILHHVERIEIEIDRNKDVDFSSLESALEEAWDRLCTATVKATLYARMRREGLL